MASFTVLSAKELTFRLWHWPEVLADWHLETHMISHCVFVFVQKYFYLGCVYSIMANWLVQWMTVQYTEPKLWAQNRAAYIYSVDFLYLSVFKNHQCTWKKTKSCSAHGLLRRMLYSASSLHMFLKNYEDFHSRILKEIDKNITLILLSCIS